MFSFYLLFLFSPTTVVSAITLWLLMRFVHQPLSAPLSAWGIFKHVALSIFISGIVLVILSIALHTNNHTDKFMRIGFVAIPFMINLFMLRFKLVYEWIWAIAFATTVTLSGEFIGHFISPFN